MTRWRYELDHQYRSARVDDQGHTRRVKYQVTTDDRNAVEADVQEDSGHDWGEVDPLDSTKFLRAIEVTRPDGSNPYLWDLILDYRSDVQPGYTPEQAQTPPLERPPEFEWSYEESLENIDRDVHGNPIATLSGEAYDPPVQRPFNDLVASVTFFRSVWNASAMLPLLNTVNSDTWYGWPPGTVKFCAPRARSVIEFPWPLCFQIVYIFKCRPDGWQPRVLHAGYKHWTGEVDEQGNRIMAPNRDSEGVLYETPQPLDADGKLIKLKANGVYEKPLVWKRPEVLVAIPFSGFGV